MFMSSVPQYIEEGKDHGMNVREKAKQLVQLLKDDERLKNERAKALKAKERFAQNTMGIGSQGVSSFAAFKRIDTARSIISLCVASLYVGDTWKSPRT